MVNGDLSGSVFDTTERQRLESFIHVLSVTVSGYTCTRYTLHHHV